MNRFVIDQPNAYTWIPDHSRQAWRTGRRDFLRGIPIQENPFQGPLAAFWVAGYQAAHKLRGRSLLNPKPQNDYNSPLEGQ